MTQLWKDTPPFRAAIVRGVGETQVVELLPERENYLEVFADLKACKANGSLFIRNGNGASAWPDSLTAPAPIPEDRRKKK